MAQHGLASENESQARIPDAWPQIQGLALGSGPRTIDRFRLARGCRSVQQGRMVSSRSPDCTPTALISIFSCLTRDHVSFSGLACRLRRKGDLGGTVRSA
eukprot:7614782-Pyramimonas_sp.AAC.1